MIICVCNNISDKGLTPEELDAKIKLSPKCGQCIKYMRRRKMEKKSLRETAIEKLKECQKDGDTEGAHYDADEILCELLEYLGYGDVVKEYEEVNKWYA